MDGRSLFPRGFHAQGAYIDADGKVIPVSVRNPSRTAVGGVRYYFIDFGISTRDQSAVVGKFGVIRAPELSDNVPYDPYKTDIYILGSTFQEFLLDVSPINERDSSSTLTVRQTHPEVAFLKPLVDDMTKNAPDERPTIQEVSERFEDMKKKWGSNLLGQRLRPSEPEWFLQRVFNDVHYRIRDALWTRSAKPSGPLPFT